MLAVISPAKTLDFETPVRIRKASQPEFIDDASRLAAIMRRKSPASLKRLMGISDKLAAQNAARYAEWRGDLEPGSGTRQALLPLLLQCVFFGFAQRRWRGRKARFKRPLPGAAARVRRRRISFRGIVALVLAFDSVRHFQQRINFLDRHAAEIIARRRIGRRFQAFVAQNQVTAWSQASCQRAGSR